MRCFWYAAILRATGSLRSKARWVIDTRKTSSLSSKARWHMTPPSSPAYQGDVGRERLLAQIGRQSWGCERRQRQCLGQLSEGPFGLILIVDHSAGS